MEGEETIGHEPAHGRLASIGLKRTRQSQPHGHAFAHLHHGRVEGGNLPDRIAGRFLGPAEQLMIFDNQQSLSHGRHGKHYPNVRFRGTLPAREAERNLIARHNDRCQTSPARSRWQIGSEASRQQGGAKERFVGLGRSCL